MKKLLFLFLVLISFAGFSQSGSINISSLKSQLKDSTTLVKPSGWGVIYYNYQSSKWRYCDGAGNCHDFGSGGGGGGGSGTVTNVSFTGGLISVGTPTTTPAFTVAGTSGGIPYFSSSSTWASSGALAANALVIGGGAGSAPSTTTTGTGVLTALGVNTGSAGAFVVNGGALGTPSSGVATNLTGTASGLTAGNVTTNANLTGDITSVGNATTIGALKVATGMIQANAVTLAKMDASNATANKMLLSGASASPTWSTSTIPTSAGSTANKVLLSDGTNYVLSTPTFPNASATSGKTIRSDGTNWIASTATFSDAPSTALKWLRSDGTNWITSTSTLAEGAVTSGKILKSDGTNWVASTETYAPPGSTGNLLVSDGTNWTATDAITINSPSQLNFGGTVTTTANNQTYLSTNPSITLRGTASDAFNFAQYRPTLIAGANNQVLSVLDLDATFTLGAFTGTTTRFITSSTYAVLSNGQTFFGSNLVASIGAANSGGFNGAGKQIRLEGQLNANNDIAIQLGASNSTTALTSGTLIQTRVAAPLFQPSIGTTNLTLFEIKSSFNQTGSASGTITDLDINNTETSVTGTHNGIIQRSTAAKNGIATSTPNSILQLNGSFSLAYVAKTGNYTLTISDYTVEVTSGTNTQTLPTAVGIQGRVYTITNSGSGTVTIGTTSSQTFANVSGTPTTLSVAQFHGYTVQSNNVGWIVIASF